jgi:putative ABC transport system permease protein
VESKNAHVHNKVMTEVSRVLGKESLISTYGCFKPASSAMDINKKVLGFLFILVFAFVMIIAFKNQYSSIVERRHDLGVLSAIGWSNKNIITMILLESILQILIGGIFAVILFSVFVLTLPLQSIIPTATELHIYIAGFIFFFGFLTTAVAGIIASVVPTWLNIRNVPAKNLRILY